MRKFELVVVGTSLGGLQALEKLLCGLPANFPLPIAIVQHRRAGSGDLLRGFMQNWSALPVEEVEDKTAIVPGHIYLAPASYHLLVEEDYFTLSTEGPIQYVRPSIDVLFESAARAYGSRVIAVVLTGANKDGAYGVKKIKERGGWVIVQEPATAEGRVMPEAAIAATVVDQILPLSELATYLVEFSSSVKQKVL